MTSALHWATWILAGSAIGAAIGALLGGPIELFAATAILAALTWLAWGFRVHPDPDSWVTNNQPDGGRSVMAYEYEIGEWKRAMYGSTEAELDIAANSHRAGVGVGGDREDARDEMSRW